MAALEPIHADPTFRIFSARNLQVNVWTGPPTVDQMRSFERAGIAISRRHPRGAGLINVMLSGKASFSQEVRDETVRLMKTTNSYRLGSAHVVLVDGFTGTAVRAFMSTVMLLGRPPSPNKVFGDVESAAQWLVPQLALGAEAWSTAEIVSLVKQAATPR